MTHLVAIIEIPDWLGSVVVGFLLCQTGIGVAAVLSLANRMTRNEGKTESHADDINDLKKVIADDRLEWRRAFEKIHHEISSVGQSTQDMKVSMAKFDERQESTKLLLDQIMSSIREIREVRPI